MKMTNKKIRNVTMKFIPHVLLISTLFPLAACAMAPELATPTSQKHVTATSSVIQPTESLFVQQTETSIASIPQLPTASAVPNAFKQLPAGDYIVYVKNEGSGFITITSLHIFSLDGREYGLLAVNTPKNATLSPDGENIAYSNFVDLGTYELTLVNLKTYKTQGFSIPNCYMSNNTPAWSPNGTQLAVSCGNYISIISIEAGELSIVVTLNSVKDDDVIWDPAWSPDGKYISFYISKPLDARDSSAHGPYIIDSICSDNISQCQVTPTSFGVEDISISKWTPDNLLAVVQNNRINLFNPVTHKMVKSIIISANTPILSFAWSPDNQWIAFNSVSNESYNAVYIMPPSGGQPTLLSNDGGNVVFWLQIPRQNK